MASRTTHIELAASHYDAGGAPVRDPEPTGMNRENIKMFNTSGMNRKSPGRTTTTLHRGKNRQRQSYGNAPVNYISKPVLCQNATGIHQATPGHNRRRPCPDEFGRSNGIPGLFRDAADFHRGSTGALPATIGALSGLHGINCSQSG
ncbi:hypothetical protein DPMN_135345 [Dreissena polymorpha]|uniref:Uncharacterized protein n=1 Tax=Dreissena polymorpha TaxID=45954 RepID=A0A9D4G1N7_DREPO|nr:hypothetical protein DPMN_135345 [Dreissena polymorpha]